MRQLIFAALLLTAFLGAMAIADDFQPAAPSSPQAIEATREHDAALAQAQRAYLKAVIAADEDYISQLQAALEAAMWSQNLDLARLLEQQKKDALAVLKKHQSDMATDKRNELVVNLGHGVTMTLVPIPAGQFIMGSLRETNAPPHRVTISKPFYMGKYPVTQEQWDAVMGHNSSGNKGAKNPVEWVSWNEIQEFMAKVNKKLDAQKASLPTEAQWEYACRAGTTTAYNTGDGEEALKEAGWYTGNSEGKTHPVGQKTPNAWGLYDMHGNVWEWVSDWYGDYPAGEVTDPTGPDQGGLHVIRGGGWTYGPLWCHSACRAWFEPNGHGHDVGFRLAVTECAD